MTLKRKVLSKFREQFRIESSRLKSWDYSSDGLCFVTICTKNREHFFGDIVNGIMRCSRMGDVVTKEWENTKNIRSNVRLDTWVVMPNHLHGIIVIENIDGRDALQCSAVPL